MSSYSRATVERRVEGAQLLVEPAVELVVDSRPLEAMLGRLDEPVERHVEAVDEPSHQL
ncbi:MAG: hypothetical protein ACXW15_11555 [Acidimicrobiia bacterium]